LSFGSVVRRNERRRSNRTSAPNAPTINGALNHAETL